MAFVYVRCAVCHEEVNPYDAVRLATETVPASLFAGSCMCVLHRVCAKQFLISGGDTDPRLPSHLEQYIHPPVYCCVKHYAYAPALAPALPDCVVCGEDDKTRFLCESCRNRMHTKICRLISSLLHPSEIKKVLETTLPGCRIWEESPHLQHWFLLNVIHHMKGIPHIVFFDFCYISSPVTAFIHFLRKHLVKCNVPVALNDVCTDELLMQAWKLNSADAAHHIRFEAAYNIRTGRIYDMCFLPSSHETVILKKWSQVTTKDGLVKYLRKLASHRAVRESTIIPLYQNAGHDLNELVESGRVLRVMLTHELDNAILAVRRENGREE